MTPPDSIESSSLHPRVGSRITEALAFDDVLLVPSYSTVVPGAVDTTTRLTRTIKLNIPLMGLA